MDTTLGRPIALRRTPLRAHAVALLLLILIAAATAIYVGSHRRDLAPFGPADNGAVLYSSSGDIYIRDAMETSGQVLVGDVGLQSSPSWSPDGQWFSYVTTMPGQDHFMAARADGSGGRELR